MLTQQIAKTLNYTGNINNYKIQNITFARIAHLWNKNIPNGLTNIIQNNAQLYAFFKYGKTLGMTINRFVKYYDSVLYYYEDQQSNQCKGSCNLQNIYLYILQCTNNYVLYLTNGYQASALHFTNNIFIKSIQAKILKDVIQLNFKEKYKVVQEIGQGTFSKVYAVINRSTNKKYAAKIMPKTDSTGFNIKGIVQEQKKILKCLNSPLICQMYQFFQDTHNYIFILQFLVGKDLSKIIKEYKQMPVNDNIYILKQILKSLSQIHKKDIIHRDLKPQNIVVDLKSKQVKLIDFGLSLLYDNKTQLHKFMRCGTMGYIAPEVVNNDQLHRARYDCKSDMFAFGIIAHMLLLGSNPIRGKTYKDTVNKNLKGIAQLDKKTILLRYGRSCLEFLQSLFQKDSKLRPTAAEALQNKFLQQKYKDEQSVVNTQFNQEQATGDKNDDINYIEDKQHMVKASKFNTLKESLQLSSPIKIPSSKKTAASWMSSSYKLSGMM